MKNRNRVEKQWKRVEKEEAKRENSVKKEGKKTEHIGQR